MKVNAINDDTGEAEVDLDESESKMLINIGFNQLLVDAIERESPPQVLIIIDEDLGIEAFKLPMSPTSDDILNRVYEWVINHTPHCELQLVDIDELNDLTSARNLSWKVTELKK